LVNKVRKVLWDQNPDKDVWKDPDPDDLTIDNAYKTRWIWYHTILGLLALMVNMELLAIIIILAIKL
tara:strand:- start:2811 stop:3011 length:201 start_codon:yes stop_codon:yes gene_type:complete